MKTPTIDWENSSDDFIAGFESNPNETYRNLNRGDVEAIIVADVARAQRMAAAGLRHLQAILGANKASGKRDRWRRDALAPVYFGKTSSVSVIEAVHRRMERAHRRLRDDRLHIRMREQRHATSDITNGRNTGGFLSPKRFQLFPNYCQSNSIGRSGTIIHELLHEWLIDQKIGNNTISSDSETRRLASRDPAKARKSPANFENFITEVWRDEGLETPSGATYIDTALLVDVETLPNATGLLSDRPVITEATMGGRRDLVFVALRAQSDETLIPAIFETDDDPITRRGGNNPTGAISYPATCCTLPDGTIISAVRGSESKRLKLIAWEVNNETPNRVSDSGNLYGDVYSHPDIISLGGGRMCVTFKGKSGKMKIDLVEYVRGRGFERYANAETSGAINDHCRACLVSPVDDLYGAAQEESPNDVLIATAFRTREGKLSVNLWSGEFGRKRVSRHGGLVDRKMTGRPSIAALALGDRPCVVVAVRDEETGRLRLTAFDVGDRSRPRRLGDTGNSGPRMSHSPDIVPVMDGFDQQVATAIRYSVNGRIIVSTWSIPDDSKGFIRQRHSGPEVTPEIESTPSMVAIAGRDSGALLTSSIGKNGRLALQLWAARNPDPVRTNG